MTSLRPALARTVGWLALAAAMSACGAPEEQRRAAPASAGGTLIVYAVNEPLRYFAERIGGPAVRAIMPAPVGVDPADWWPGAEVVLAYQRADLILANGGGYAAWLSRASIPRARLVDTSRAFAGRLIPLTGAVTHQHGPEGDHSHEGLATTVWLDPELALLQARAIAGALTSARPLSRSAFERGLAELESDLRALDDLQRRATDRLPSGGLAFSHPVYQYLQRRYGLTGPSLHWEPGDPPGPKEWSAFERLARGAGDAGGAGKEPIELMLWEAPPDAATAERLAGLGVEVLVYAPGGGAPTGGDWLEAMQSNVQRLADTAGRLDP